MSRRNRFGISRGFSLIELMIAIAIAGVLMAIAAPSLRDLMAIQRARAVSFDLYSALTLARSEAQKRSAPIFVRAAADGWATGWCVLTADVVCSLTAPGAETIQIFDGVPLEVNVGVTEKGTATSISVVSFSGNGRRPATEKVVEFEVSLAGGGGERCITLPLTGSAVSEGKSC